MPRNNEPRFVSPIRLLVTGSHKWTDRVLIAQAIYAIHCTRGIALLLHGNSRGADRLADSVAKDFEIERQSFPIDWKKHGTKAEAIRNHQMLSEGKPDLVLAFSTDIRTDFDTKDCVSRARLRGIQIAILPAERRWLLKIVSELDAASSYENVRKVA